MSTNQQTASTEETEAPETYGEVSPEILNAVTQLRARSESLVAEIGRMEIHKVAMAKEVMELNDKAGSLLQQEAQRLEIPEGTSWRLTPEGHAMMVEGG